MSSDYILVKVSGQDQPGITSSLMHVIVENEGKIIDIGQSVTHGLLSLSFLLEFSKDSKTHPVVKDLLFEAKKMGLQLDFDIIENEPKYPENIHEKFILNCVSQNDLKASFIRDVSKTLAQHNINILRIDCISPDRFHSLEMTTTVSTDQNISEVKKELLDISADHKVDMAFLKDNVFRRNKRLIVFDMDSTLIQTEVIDEMALEHGVGEEIKEITENAMNGKINFDQSLMSRVGKLKGLEEKTLHKILERLQLTKGSEDFIKTVKKLGYKVALISGGFTFFANALKDKLNLDYAFANELELVNGKLTGNIKGTIVNAEQKALLVKIISQQMGINLEQVVAIGDGANDLPMLSTAGLGIAYHAKEIVKERADHQLSHGPMTTILHFLGITDKDIKISND